MGHTRHLENIPHSRALKRHQTPAHRSQWPGAPDSNNTATPASQAAHRRPPRKLSNGRPALYAAGKPPESDLQAGFPRLLQERPSPHGPSCGVTARALRKNRDQSAADSLLVVPSTLSSVDRRLSPAHRALFDKSTFPSPNAPPTAALARQKSDRLHTKVHTARSGPLPERLEMLNCSRYSPPPLREE